MAPRGSPETGPALATIVASAITPDTGRALDGVLATADVQRKDAIAFDIGAVRSGFTYIFPVGNQSSGPPA